MKYYYLISEQSTSLAYRIVDMEKILSNENLVEMDAPLITAITQSCKIVINDQAYHISKQYIDLTREVTIYMLSKTMM